MADGWARLGDALAGDSEIEYQKGLALGANTENALAQARERVTKAKAQMELAEKARAAGVPETLAQASATVLTAGGGFKDVGDLLSNVQERGFRDDAAGVTGLDFATGNRRLMGVANAPVDRFQTIGNKAVDDRFDDAGPVALPPGAVGSGSGGTAAALQILEAYGFLGPDGRVIPGKEAEAFDVMRSTERSVDVGGVPSVVSANPFRRTPGAAGPTAVAAATPQDVAGNAGALAASKTMPESFQRLRNQSAQADLVIGKVDDALKDTSWISAGPMGWVTRNVPGTPAFTLDQTVNTIKANAGFQQLQQMRYESPTGGALGNVTVQELEFLQSALSSLNTAQDPAILAKSLGAVRDHYTRFKEYAAQDYELAQERAQYRQPTAPAAPVAPGAAPPAAGETRIHNGKKYVKVGNDWFEDDGT